VWE